MSSDIDECVRCGLLRSTHEVAAGACFGFVSAADIKAASSFSKARGRQIRKAQAERAAAPTTDPTASERDAVTAEAVRLLRAHPAVLKAWKQSAGHVSKSKYQVAPAGLPDICFVLRRGARFGGFEVKKPGDRHSLSQAQLDTLRELQVAGAITGIITAPGQAVEIMEAASQTTWRAVPL